MKKSTCLSLLGLFCSATFGVGQIYATPDIEVEQQARVTDANIVGHVLDSKTGDHIAGISIRIKGTPFGAYTDASGHYRIVNIKPGRYTIVMQGTGYLTQERVLDIVPKKTVEVNFTAVEDVLRLDEVVVTANRQATLRKYAPTLVSVIGEAHLKQSNAVNLAQGLSFQPGLRVENNCQNCGFNQVRINGLDGHFSQILIDSRPVFSSLAGVYGLEHIPVNMIDRVEVVRGGGSALYGSSAIAGVINIITKNPTSNSFSFSNNLTFTGGKTPDNTLGVNAALVSPDARTGAVVFAQSRDRSAWDANGDGYSEMGKINGKALGTRAFFNISPTQNLTAEAHTIYEYRRGGDHLDLPDHLASVSERTEHYINSGNIKYDLFSEDTNHHLQAYASGQMINRNSYYGGIGDGALGSLGKPTDPANYGINYGYTKGRTYMGGLQYEYNMDRLLFMPAQFLLGTEYVYDSLYDIMPIRNWTLAEDGKTSLYPPLNQVIHNFSQIGQLEFKNDMWTILLGARLDQNSAIRTADGKSVKPILSPRATLRFNPNSSINLRASYAKGFRAPQVFDEDLHVGVVQGEVQKIVNIPNLKPEYSHSFSLSSDMYFNTESVRTNILVEGFYTRLIGAFNTEYVKSENGFKIYNRINGSNATVYGLNLEGKLVWNILSVQAGLTLAKSQWDVAQATGAERSLLAGEDSDNPKNIDTAKEFGPKTLDGFAFKVEDGNRVYDETVEILSKDFMRTPNVYGYFTVNINPVKPLNLSLTANYTGTMKVPHAIEVGRMSAVKDIELVKSGLRPDTREEENAPMWGVVEQTPQFFDLGAKISYDLRFFSASTLQLYAGVNNLLNSFQKDFDSRGFRDSGYIYGPTQPFSIYCGAVIKF